MIFKNNQNALIIPNKIHNITEAQDPAVSQLAMNKCGCCGLIILDFLRSFQDNQQKLFTLT